MSVRGHLVVPRRPSCFSDPGARHVALALIALSLLAPRSAGAAQLPAEPYGWRYTSSEVVEIASRLPKVQAERAKHGTSTIVATPRLQDRRWEISVVTRPARAAAEEIAHAVVDDASGEVLDVWSGPEVNWPMARGYPGAFGGAINAPWVWAGLCVMFALPFLRRPVSLVHLDVAVLLGFSLSYAAFNQPALQASVVSAYLLLAYMLARMLWMATRDHRGAAFVPGVPDTALWVGLVFLLGFRVAVSLSGNVIDVGYAGVIGADHLTRGVPMYGAFPDDNAHGDTYGPVLYLAYVPWELLFPWSGAWDSLTAARAAAVSFDLACVALCWVLGRNLGSKQLGLVLAYLWAAYPFTLLVLASGGNDALVAALVLAAVAVSERPVLRGAAIALVGLTKFAPLALLPLLATYRKGLRGVVLTVAGAVLVTTVVLNGFDLSTFWSRTLGYQAGRASPFSIWGRWESLEPLHIAAQLSVVMLAGLVAFLPRQRSVARLCALAAAVLVLVELCLGYWFYSYLLWFLPLVLVAIVAPQRAIVSSVLVNARTSASTGRSAGP